MTITLKSNPDGVSGAIQVNGVDRLTVNSSGAVTASTNPATGLRSTALATMQKFADEFGSSLSGNGYQKLPSGLIIQWGPTGAVSSASGAVTVTFPIAFPTACRAIAFGPNATQGVMVAAESIAAANFAYSAFAPGGGRLASIGTWFIAIGN